MGLAAAWVTTIVAAVFLAAWWIGPPETAEPLGAAPVRPGGYDCDFTTTDGRLYAGHSTTSERLVVLNYESQDVVEVQCLLTHHGITVGRIDGRFGEHTENAVKVLQRAHRAVIDGKVGPQTWILLRT